jgi:hypothetical protein
MNLLTSECFFTCMNESSALFLFWLGYYCLGTGAEINSLQCSQKASQFSLAGSHYSIHCVISLLPLAQFIIQYNATNSH